jgi:DNA-binding NarL/FixJ family response regulator
MSNLILLGMRLLSDALPTNTRRHLESMTDARRPRSCVSRLLIADDRSRTRRALRAVLSARPEIELIGEAADGEEAISAVERLRPDIVILDIRMPRLDGIAATRHIKTRWPEIRVIAHSLAEELRGDVLAAGADAFVAKGAPVQELLEALGHQRGDQRANTNVCPPAQYS